jgi:hypothetical protein
MLKSNGSDKSVDKKAIALAKQAVNISASLRELVEALIEKVYVFPENRIEVQWKIVGFATMEK